jgi:hypothetical protein
MVLLVTSKDRQHVQHVTAPIPITIQGNTLLPTYVPKGSAHQPPDGGQPKDSPRESSPKGNPLGGPPFNPPIGSYRWPTPNPHMFIPPWYQPLVMQLVPKPATKLPYRISNLCQRH